MRVGGKLKFKDNGKGILGRRKKEEEPQIQQIFQQHLKIKDKITNYEPFQGSGLILTSNTGVNGEDTKFKDEITKGDTIEVQHPVSKQKEEKKVMIVFGDKSLMLEEAFSQDITTFTSFTVKKAPKVEKGHDLSQEYQKKLQQIQKKKPINKAVLNVRVKKGTWSYETKKVDLKQGMTKEDQLDIRQKMIKDKFCW